MLKRIGFLSLVLFSIPACEIDGTAKYCSNEGGSIQINDIDATWSGMDFKTEFFSLIKEGKVTLAGPFSMQIDLKNYSQIISDRKQYIKNSIEISDYKVQGYETTSLTIEDDGILVSWVLRDDENEIEFFSCGHSKTNIVELLHNVSAKVDTYSQ